MISRKEDTALAYSICERIEGILLGVASEYVEQTILDDFEISAHSRLLRPFSMEIILPIRRTLRKHGESVKK
jgi:hypothetical protein